MSMKHKQSLLYLFVLFFINLVSYQISAQTITLNTTGKPPLNDSSMKGFMDQVAQEAFRRVGVTLKTTHLPAERGLLNANAGIEDGEMSRIAGLQHLYPNLIQVPEKIMDWEFVAVGKPALATENGWRCLAGSNVAIINGWKILERNVTPIASVTKVGNSDQLFSMLQRQRTDFVLYERWSAAKYLHDMSLKEASIKMPPLATREMFIYLHRKHAALVPQLAATLRDMKTDGSYQKIRDNTLMGYMK